MTVRAIDIDGDWIYGIGRSAYISGNDEVSQNIRTRLLSFLGDCFFDLGAGVNWFGFLGFKDQLSLNLAVTAIITNTINVSRVVQLSVDLSSTRRLTILYSVNTSFMNLSSSIPALTGTVNFMLTESGDVLTTEDGSGLVLE